MVTENWVQCSQVNDPNIDPNTRWQTGMADAALVNATTYYNNNRLGGTSTLHFDESTSYYFHGPDNYDCQLLVSSCDSGAGVCSNTTSPAGYLILNSFSNFHNVGSSSYFPPQLLGS